MAPRSFGRGNGGLRPVTITPGFMPAAEGSCLIQVGDTHVICTASWDESVPRHRKGSGKGWLSAEYAMLPRSTTKRTPREARMGRQDGRTVEIQRLIGRALRSVVNFAALGERTLVLDCDVLRADGGTRTAAITGSWVAMCLAFRNLRERGFIVQDPVKAQVAAVSVGQRGADALLDLDYSEDSTCDVDMNIVGTSEGNFIEVQGTGEARPFSREELDALLDLARQGLSDLFAAQKASLA